MNIYDFTVETRKGGKKALSEYRGKILLVVNTATGCGFTPQYAELQSIYKDYQNGGFEILDFPCNQFGEQAPGSDDEIHTFCTGRFGITFEQFSKIDVNGEDAIPLYKWLVENTTFDGFDALHPIGLFLNQMLKEKDADFDKNSSIKWNFTKFLIDREGNIVARFEPTASIKKISAKIKEIL